MVPRVRMHDARVANDCTNNLGVLYATCYAMTTRTGEVDDGGVWLDVARVPRRARHCTSWFHSSSSEARISANGSTNAGGVGFMTLRRLRVWSRKPAICDAIWFFISLVPTREMRLSSCRSRRARSASARSARNFSSCARHFSFHSYVCTVSKHVLCRGARERACRVVSRAVVAFATMECVGDGWNDDGTTTRVYPRTRRTRARTYPDAALSVSYAALARKNMSISSSTSHTSGWYRFAMDLYARLHASADAPGDTPSAK